MKNEQPFVDPTGMSRRGFFQNVGIGAMAGGLVQRNIYAQTTDAQSKEVPVPVTRINEFHAKEGEEESLGKLIESFVPLIESSEGCRSCQLLRNLEDPAHIIVIEVWDNTEAHKASAKNIPPGTIQQAMKLMDEPPKGAYFHASSG